MLPRDLHHRQSRRRRKPPAESARFELTGTGLAKLLTTGAARED